MIQLPIDSYLEHLVTQFKAHKNLILMASPGSGKTTRFPPALVDAGFKKIVVLVPKRIAAVSAADRIAEENQWELGREVGYHVRFEPLFKKDTNLIFMTEGVFIKKAQNDEFWKSFDVIIFDEFHERSALADMALGLAVERQILEDSLKIIVMSATLNAESLAAFLPDTKIIEINAPPHPLKLIYSTKQQKLICDNDFYAHLVQLTADAWNQNEKDILIFLPGMGEIRRAETAIRKKFPDLLIRILHGSVKLSEQREILKSSSSRRLVLATDIAESSLTLPSVDAVIDCGLKKVAQLDLKLGFSQLSLQRISQFSAKQRAGRAARVGAGTCYRMWHESDERSMPEQIKPEILKSPLHDEILTLKNCGVDSISNFMWLDRPPEIAINHALKRLRTWNLLNEKDNITSLGKSIQALPLGIENGLLFFNLAVTGFQAEAAHLIAALETTDLARVFAEPSMGRQPDLQRIFESEPLTYQGQRIKTQLEGYRLGLANRKTTKDFRHELLAILFYYFPNRIAQRKSDTDGVSSNGRGVTLAKGLNARHDDYYAVLAGYNSGDRTDIHLAVGMSKNEFIEISKENIEQTTRYILDLEKQRIFRQQSKGVGQFIISESSRQGLSGDEERKAWPVIVEENTTELLEAHPDFERIAAKINFLRSKLSVDFDFVFDETLFADMNVHSLNEFLNYPLAEIIYLKLPENIQKMLKQLPNAITLPSGRVAKIDYICEKSPLISAKIQDFYGMKETPTLLDQKIPMTLELLAPSLRPTQITQNLKLFWEKSYFEIRKELKARYPKQQWPDNPADYKLEPRKK